MNLLLLAIFLSLGAVAHWTQTWGEIHEGAEPTGCYGSTYLGTKKTYADAKHAMLNHETCSKSGHYLMFNAKHYYWGTWCCHASRSRRLVPSSWTTYKLQTSKVKTDIKQIYKHSEPLGCYGSHYLGHKRTYEQALDAMLSHWKCSQGGHYLMFNPRHWYWGTWCCSTRRFLVSSSWTTYRLEKHTPVHGRRLLHSNDLQMCAPAFDFGKKSCVVDALTSSAEKQLKKFKLNMEMDRLVQKAIEMVSGAVKKQVDICIGDMSLKDFEKQKKEELDSLGCGGLAALNAKDDSQITILGANWGQKAICMAITKCANNGLTFSFGASKDAIRALNEKIGGPLLELAFNLETVSFGYSASNTFGQTFHYYDGDEDKKGKLNGNFYTQLDYNFNLWEVVKKELEDDKNSSWLMKQFAGFAIDKFPITLENAMSLNVEMPLIQQLGRCLFLDSKCSKEQALQRLRETKFLITSSGQLQIDFSKIHAIFPKLTMEISDGHIFGSANEGLFVSYSASSKIFQGFQQICQYISKVYQIQCPDYLNKKNKHVVNTDLWFKNLKIGVRIHADFASFQLECKLNLRDGSLDCELISGHTRKWFHVTIYGYKQSLTALSDALSYVWVDGTFFGDRRGVIKYAGDYSLLKENQRLYDSLEFGDLSPAAEGVQMTGLCEPWSFNTKVTLEIKDTGYGKIKFGETLFRKGNEQKYNYGYKLIKYRWQTQFVNYCVYYDGTGRKYCDTKKWSSLRRPFKALAVRHEFSAAECPGHRNRSYFAHKIDFIPMYKK